MSKQNWDWVTSDMEAEALHELVTVSDLLSNGDIYAIAKEEYNNEILEHLAMQHGHCTACGLKLDEEGACPECDDGPGMDED